MEMFQMAIEIERRFLADISVLGVLENGVEIIQGYVLTKNRVAVRARIMGDNAFVTFKGDKTGFTRLEFEYPIPLEDAKQIISNFCSGKAIEKTRFYKNYEEHTWDIDLFKGDNDGLVIAEVEVKTEDEVVQLPKWVTKEITGDKKYNNFNLVSNPYTSWDKEL